MITIEINYEKSEAVVICPESKLMRLTTFLALNSYDFNADDEAGNDCYKVIIGFYTKAHGAQLEKRITLFNK